MKEQNTTNIFKVVEMTNSILYPGDNFKFSFTKKQYYKYLLNMISWFRLIKTIFIILGIIGLIYYQPLFLISGIVCLAIDAYSFLVKKLSWYFIIIFPILYIYWSWHEMIYFSFVLGVINLLLEKSFYKKAFEVDLKKIQAKDIKITKRSKNTRA
ncbi:MAG: hypothetical protein BWY19_00198 [bacterium ADurb.Bin212]|nr:MAG: hypothetical protein BWY19_00198 [bacterium ADurb.Bin212]